MAYVYRYSFKKLDVREKINLLDFESEIITILKDEIKDNLKYCSVEKEYLEIRIHFPLRIDMEYRSIFRRIRQKIMECEDRFEEKDLYFTKEKINYNIFIDREEYKEFKDGISSTYNAEVILCDDISRINNNKLEKQKYIADLDILKIFDCDENIATLDKLNNSLENVRVDHGNYYVVEIFFFF